MLFMRSRRIAVFLSQDGEISLKPLIKRAWQLGKSCYLPIVCPDNSYRLWFSRYTCRSSLVKNAYGIPEPSVQSSELLPCWALDLVLVPLVAFDSHGGRLGMGKGYYDRTFAKDRLFKQPKLLGVAHQCQHVAKLPLQPWDVMLDGIVTDSGYYPVAPGLQQP
jgi:5-formyltetrahydrofolate cyclo-ligase